MARFLSFVTVALLAVSDLGAQTPEGELRFNQALLHMREGRPEMALQEFKKAIDQDKNNPYFHKGLGLAYVQLRKYDDAVETFQKVLQLNPYYIDVRNDLGTAFILMGKRDEGKKEFLQAFGEPTNPSPELAARNLGQAYLEEQNYTEALRWFQTSVKRNTRYADAQLGLADSLIALGRLEEAAVQLEAASNNIPDDYNILAALGDAYFRAGRFTEARAKLEHVAKMDPGGPAGRRAVEKLKSLPR